MSSEEQLHGFLEESLIMKDFHHPHILGLLGVCFDAPDGSPYIVLPFMANGSVKTYLKERRVHPTNFDESPVVNLTLLSYLAVFSIAKYTQLSSVVCPFWIGCCRR